MPAKLKIEVDNLPKIRKAIEDLVATRILVGIPDASPAHDADGKAMPITLAGIGYIHENGAPEANIPPRPFLKPGVVSVQEKITAGFLAAGRAALTGDGAGVERRFEAIGTIAQRGVQQKITEGPFVPLKPKTLAARRRKGFTGEKPLIVTGELRRAVRYVIQRGAKSEE